MIYLILSILCSTAILMIFKLMDQLKINIFPPIVINYIAAIIMGSLLSGHSFSAGTIISSDWLFMALIIGMMFIIMFFVIGISTQKAGITATSVAGRLSMIIPMIFSIVFYNEAVYQTKLLGIILAVVAIILTIYRNDIKKSYRKYLFLPVLLFAGMGLTDTLVKISQQTLIPEKDFALFSTLAFFSSAFIGIVVSILRKSTLKSFLNVKTQLFGIILGIVNYFSLYFFINALEKSGLDSSIVFGVNNLSIICLSVLLAFLIFKERIRPINWVGVFVSIAAILLLNIVS